MSRGYREWTQEEDDLLAKRVAEGVTSPRIATELDRTSKSVSKRIEALGISRYSRTPPSDAEQWEQARDAHAASVRRNAETYDWLRPVEMEAPPRVPVTSAPAPFTLVAGDFHFGMQDDRAVALFLRAIEEIRPRQVILNGDTVDLLAVSRYPKDCRRGKKWDLRDEVRPFHGFLKDLHAIGDSWGVKIVETSANHSGNGTDGRWWRYLNDRCPELLGHDEAEERLSYQTWFFPTWSSITLEDSVMVADDLLVMHGDMVRSEAGYTAKASREKWMNSVLVNHTHRIGLAPKTITAIQGKPTSYVRGYENGCLCKLEVPYGRALNWQQGFAVVGESTECFAVEQVFIDNGRCNVAALGKTLSV